MEVFFVTFCSPEIGEQGCGVFSTRKLAEKFISKFPHNKMYEITSYILDEKV